jgi:glycosyltransferase involved in cell wall biosynthesis
VETFCDHLVEGLCRSGLPAVRLLTEGPAAGGPPRTRGRQVPTEELQVSHWATWRQRWRALREYLEAHAPCVYLPNDDFHHSCIGPTLAPGVRVLGVVHSDSTWHYDQLARLGPWWDAVVAVSATIERQARVVDASLASRLHVIHYGVPVAGRVPERPREPGAPLRVLYAGRLIQLQKRVFDLPRVVAVGAARGVPVELTVMGDGPDADEFRARCAPFIARGSIRVWGAQSNGAVLEALAGQDVAIMTSEFEGLPLSLLEAMGQGCVPVFTDTRSGIPEVIVDGMNGYRVPVGALGLFAQRLEELHRDPARLARMATEAWRTVAEGGFRAEDMVAGYRRLCTDLLEDTAGRFARTRGRVRPPLSLKGQGWVPYPIWLRERSVFQQVQQVLPRVAGRWSPRSTAPGFEWLR